MNWQNFQTHNEALTKAFEAFCNQLFEKYCQRNFSDELKYFTVVNGAGGDGGVESYVELNNGDIIGVQAKWFREILDDAQLNNIKNSINTALTVRPSIKKYIICIPRDLTSEKKVKGNKIAKNTEENKWKQLLSEIKEFFPNLEIILWNESELLNQLQKPGSEDIQRYWFESSEFSIETLKYSFNKQKESWLKFKYLPDLHINGEISEITNKFVGSVFIKNKLQQHIENILNIHQELLQIIKRSQNFCKLSDNLKIIMNEIELTAINNINLLEQYHNALISSIKIYNYEMLERIDFKNLLDEFMQVNSRSNSYYYEFERVIKKCHNIDFYSLKQDFDLMKRNLLIFIGNPGTGKTHGIANIANVFLNNENHIPLLIQAKSISKDDTWKDIIIKTMGLAQDWSEEEILNAFEALSYRLEIKQLQKKENNDYSIPKVLICIDGLDEFRPFDFWINKLREVEVISRKYSRIKFCVTSRPCTFKNLEFNDDLKLNSIHLNVGGDVAVNEIYDNYLKAYNINIINADWLKWTLKTPLTLKLFCEVNHNKTLSDINRKSITISKLIEQKIEVIDEEFRNQCNNYDKQDYIIHNSILLISDYFLRNNVVEKSILLKSLKNSSELTIVNDADFLMILNTLEHHGFLQTFIKETGVLTKLKQTYYEKGIQPFFDYFLALKLFEKYPYPLKDNFENEDINNYTNMLQMYSSILLEEKGILVSEIPYFKENISRYELITLDFFALANNNTDAVATFKGKIMSFMNNNASCLIKVLNEIILPVSRIEEHPLGSLMLHEYLSSFEKPAERDMVWSIQRYLPLEDKGIWNCNINSNIDHYNLNSEDKWNGLPLIFAWMLTNIDEDKRLHYRKELTNWAISNPNEYYKVFELTYLSTNDPQMQSELLSIAMGLVYSISIEHDVLNLFSKFILKNIFNKLKIKNINNAAIRQYARCIAERAFQAKLIDNEILKTCVPPFEFDLNYNLPLYKEATTGDRMAGYKSISYDLARYVLIDPILDLFFDKDYKNYIENSEPKYYCDFEPEEIDKILITNPNLNTENKKSLMEIKKYKEERECSMSINRQFIDYELDNDEEEDAAVEKFSEKRQNNDFYKNYNDKAVKFIEQQSVLLNIEHINCGQYILATAYAYLLDKGWDEEDFGRGLDCAIKCLCSPATHGSKSRIMTICEKYIWCFKHEIFGYLFDRLGVHKSYSDTQDISMNDYSLIINNFVNPAQEICTTNDIAGETSNKWILPEVLNPTFNDINSNSREDIISWLKKVPDPNFSKWIDIKNNIVINNTKEDYLSLYCSNVVIEKNIGVCSFLWTTCGIIKAFDFQYLLNDLKNNKTDIIKKLNNPYEINSSTYADCYITPKEVCQFAWKHELSNKIHTATLFNNKIVEYEIIKGIEECVANYEVADVYYKLPSKHIRTLLYIIDGDGIKFYDNNKRIKAFNYSVGDAFGEHQQFLCTNKELLFDKLKNRDEKIFWICRMLREPSPASFELHKNFYCKNDKVWIIWQEDNNWKEFCFSEDFLI